MIANKITLVCIFLLLARPIARSESRIQFPHSKDSVSIELHSLSIRKEDTLSIEITEFPINNPLFKKKYECIIRNNSFKLHIPNRNHPQYMSITSSIKLKNPQNVIVNSYLIETDDSISISMNNGNIQFKSSGAKKFEIQHKLDSLDSLKPIYLKSAADSKRYWESLDSLALKKLILLDEYRTTISYDTYIIFKVDIIAGTESAKVSLLNYLPDSLFRISYANLHDYENIIWTKENKSLFKSTIWAKYAKNYSFFLIQRYLFDSCNVVNKNFNLISCYNYFKNTYPSYLNDVLLMAVITKYKNRSSGLTYCLEDAINYLNDSCFKVYLKNLQIKKSIGSIAYDFTLTDTSGRSFNLHDFGNKIIILDFWFTGCTACKSTASILKTVEDIFKDDSVIFITVSIDKDRNRWIGSVKKHEYSSFSTLDLYTQGLADNHPLISKYEISGYPTLLLIGKNKRLIETPSDIRADNGKGLIDIIKSNL